VKKQGQDQKEEQPQIPFGMTTRKTKCNGDDEIPAE